MHVGRVGRLSACLDHIPALRPIRFPVPPPPPSTPFLEVLGLLDGYMAAETTFDPGVADSCIQALEVAAAAQRGEADAGVAAQHVARAVIVVAVRHRRDPFDLVHRAREELGTFPASRCVFGVDAADAAEILAAAAYEIREASGDAPPDPAIIAPTVISALLDHAVTRW